MRFSLELALGGSGIKRILSIILAIITLASCVPTPQEAEPHEREYLQPEGLFVFYYFNVEYEQLRYGLVNAQGEVIVPIEYEHIGVLRSFNTHHSFILPSNIPANERFFIVYQYLEGVALISPDGNFLTGFDYDRIHHMPGNYIQIIGWRTDGQLVLLDYYGVESEIIDERLLYSIQSLDKGFSWLEEYAWTLVGPDMPEQGFESVMHTRSGNFWGATNPPEGKPWNEIRLYDSDGFLLTGDVYYHMVTYIGDGLYMAELINEDSFRESYIVNQNGRRLAGPYQDFLYHAAPYLLGILGNTAYVMRTDSFHEFRAIEIPEDGWLVFQNMGGRPIVELLSDTQPMTLVLVDTGEKIVFHDLTGHRPMLLLHNEDLSRFVLSPEPGQAILVDRQGNILTYGYNYLIDSRLGYLVAVIRTGEDELKYSLLDWDGNLLLGSEFSFMEPLPGNALHVVREGVIGIIDLGGNWIYVHQTNHPRREMLPSFLVAES